MILTINAVQYRGRFMEMSIYHRRTPKPSLLKTKLQLGTKSLVAAISGARTTQSNSLFDYMYSGFI